jgi:hypothetical protein
MGYTPEPTIYSLNFDDTPLKGLEVKVKCCSMAEFNSMLRNSHADNLAELADKNSNTVELFLKNLVSWNLAFSDGSPVPMTIEGVQSQEQPMVNQIVGAWQTAMVTVSAPLNLPSPNGAISQEQSLGLEGKSLSHENWPKPS